jgi:hypothetical protein
MAEITVNGIGRDATDAQIEDFFSFCGKVKSVVVTPVDADTKTKSAKVLFEKSEAVKTALLLSDSELGGSKVSIVAAPGAVTHTGMQMKLLLRKERIFDKNISPGLPFLLNILVTGTY